MGERMTRLLYNRHIKTSVNVSSIFVRSRKAFSKGLKLLISLHLVWHVKGFQNFHRLSSILLQTSRFLLPSTSTQLGLHQVSLLSWSQPVIVKFIRLVGPTRERIGPGKIMADHSHKIAPVKAPDVFSVATLPLGCPRAVEHAKYTVSAISTAFCKCRWRFSITRIGKMKHLVLDP